MADDFLFAEDVLTAASLDWMDIRSFYNSQSSLLEEPNTNWQQRNLYDSAFPQLRTMTRHIYTVNAFYDIYDQLKSCKNILRRTISSLHSTAIHSTSIAENKSISLEILNDDCLLSIFKFINLNDLCTMAEISPRLFAIAQISFATAHKKYFIVNRTTDVRALRLFQNRINTLILHNINKSFVRQFKYCIQLTSLTITLGEHIEIDPFLQNTFPNLRYIQLDGKLASYFIFKQFCIRNSHLKEMNLSLKLPYPTMRNDSTGIKGFQYLRSLEKLKFWIINDVYSLVPKRLIEDVHVDLYKALSKINSLRYFDIHFSHWYCDSITNIKQLTHFALPRLHDGREHEINILNRRLVLIADSMKNLTVCHLPYVEVNSAVFNFIRLCTKLKKLFIGCLTQINDEIFTKCVTACKNKRQLLEIVLYNLQMRAMSMELTVSAELMEANAKLVTIRRGDVFDRIDDFMYPFANDAEVKKISNMAPKMITFY